MPAWNTQDKEHRLITTTREVHGDVHHGPPLCETHSFSPSPGIDSALGYTPPRARLLEKIKRRRTLEDWKVAVKDLMSRGRTTHISLARSSPPDGHMLRRRSATQELIVFHPVHVAAGPEVKITLRLFPPSLGSPPRWDRIIQWGP